MSPHSFAVFVIVLHAAVLSWSVVTGIGAEWLLKAAIKAEDEGFTKLFRWTGRLCALTAAYAVIFLMTFGPLYAVKVVWLW